VRPDTCVMQVGENFQRLYVSARYAARHQRERSSSRSLQSVRWSSDLSDRERGYAVDDLVRPIVLGPYPFGGFRQARFPRDL